MIEWVTLNAFSMLNGLAFGVLIFAIAAGLSIIFGMMDVLNLAHGIAYLVGGYVAVELATGGLTGYVLSLFVAALVGAGFGCSLDVLLRPIVRRGHLAQALLTLGIGLVAVGAIQIFWGRDVYRVAPPLSGTVTLVGSQYPLYRLFVAAAGLALAAGVFWTFQRTSFGAQIKASVADPDMLEALGVNVRRLRLAVFAIGSSLAAIAGVLGAPILGVFPAIEIEMLLLALVVLIIGGLRSLGGAFIASLVVGQIQSTGVANLPELSPFLIFGAMVLVLTVRPQGLERATT